MKHKYVCFSFAILLMLVLTGCSSSGVTQDGTLTGTVVDSATGLGFWSGQASIGGKTAQIANGQFQIRNIPAGIHKLTISKAHYQDMEMQVHISGRHTTVEVKMQPAYSAAHLDLFARLVHAESRGESYKGQVAVAASVLNRVTHRNYPNSLYGVITQRAAGGYAQYSPIDDGSINIPADQNAKDAVRDALVGWDPSDGATGFFAPAKVPNRNNWVWQQVHMQQIGNHLFFRSRID